MAKFQLDPRAPPVQRQSAPPPPPPAPAAPPPPRREEAVAAAPASRRKVALLAVAAGVVILGLGVVATMWALDLGPFAYPERYLLKESEVPPGLRFQALPPPIRSELGIEENPDRLPPEKIDEFSDAPAKEAWLQSLGTGRPGEQLIIAAVLYETEADAREGARSTYCDRPQGDGLTLRDGKVVVFVTAFTDAAAQRIPVVEAALREKADGLRVECRW